MFRADNYYDEYDSDYESINTSVMAVMGLINGEGSFDDTESNLTTSTMATEVAAGAAQPSATPPPAPSSSSRSRTKTKTNSTTTPVTAAPARIIRPKGIPRPPKPTPAAATTTETASVPKRAFRPKSKPMIRFQNDININNDNTVATPSSEVKASADDCITVSSNDGSTSASPPHKKNKKGVFDVTSSSESDHHLTCPITLQLPIHPVMAGDGRIYEESVLEEYIKKNCKGILKCVVSPITREKMSISYTPSPLIKDLIEKLIENGSIKGELAETWTKVNELLKKVEKKGATDTAELMHDVAYSYYTGKNGFPHDHKRAFVWAKKAHVADYVPATSMLALMFVNGQGVVKNVPLGVMYMGMAAQGGNDYAAYNLGKGFAFGRFGLPVDNIEAIKWLKVSLSGKCQYKLMSTNAKQKAQEFLDELISEEYGGLMNSADA